VAVLPPKGVYVSLRKSLDRTESYAFVFLEKGMMKGGN
jgi:hypothetical protein